MTGNIEAVEVGPGIRDRIARDDQIVGSRAVTVIESALTERDERILSDLALVLVHPHTRDAAILQWARGVDWGVRALVVRDPLDRDILMAHVDLATGYGPEPDVKRLADALSAVKYVAAWLPEDERPPAFSVAGWLAWALGMSNTAVHLLDEAMRLDPDYNYAFILYGYIRQGNDLPLWFAPKRATS